MILNPHKIKKQFGRGIKKASGFVHNSDSVHTQDLAWHHVQQNPFIKTGNIKNKTKMYVIIFGLILFSILSILVFHPFFRINKLEISGLQRIKKVDLESTLFGSVSYKRLFLLPANNYFLIDLDDIRDLLKEKYPIQTIVITKFFPDEISIVLEEKISTIIYDNGKEYSYLGVDGKILEKLRKVGDNEWKKIIEENSTADVASSSSSTTSTVALIIAPVEHSIHTPTYKSVVAEFGDYPILYDQRGLDLDLENKILDETITYGVIEWFNLLTKRLSINPAYFEIGDERQMVTIYTQEGWQIKAKLSSIEKQFDILSVTLKDLAQKKLNYIDLRFDNRVYWK